MPFVRFLVSPNIVEKHSRARRLNDCARSNTPSSNWSVAQRSRLIWMHKGKIVRLDKTGRTAGQFAFIGLGIELSSR